MGPERVKDEFRGKTSTDSLEGMKVLFKETKKQKVVMETSGRKDFKKIQSTQEFITVWGPTR